MREYGASDIGRVTVGVSHRHFVVFKGIVLLVYLLFNNLPVRHWIIEKDYVYMDDCILKYTNIYIAGIFCDTWPGVWREGGAAGLVQSRGHTLSL